MVMIATALLAQRLHDILYGNTSGADEGSPAGKGRGDGASAMATPTPDTDSLRVANPANADTVANVLRLLLLKIALPMLSVQIPSVNSIEYYHIWGSQSMTMCLFVLKKGSTLPIHSHPNMTVFSRVIHGDLHVKTYHLEEDSRANTSSSNSHSSLPTASASEGVTPASSPRLFQTTTQPSSHAQHPNLPHNARLHRDEVISHTSPGLTSILEINSNTPNLHTFTAVSDHVVVFDLIFPPYDEDARMCSYYQERHDSANITGDVVTTVATELSRMESSGLIGKEHNAELHASISRLSVHEDGYSSEPREDADGDSKSPKVPAFSKGESHKTGALKDHTSSLFEEDHEVNSEGLQMRLVELDYGDEIESVAYVGQQVKRDQLERGSFLTDAELVQLGGRVAMMVDRMSASTQPGQGHPGGSPSGK
ncbi:hypothetical protein HDU78_002181 [Chytriomyces hyalinus]|nr:hypothetical protein HDU78_002181 [Chytriomyces hyalinus]